MVVIALALFIGVYYWSSYRSAGPALVGSSSFSASDRARAERSVKQALVNAPAPATPQQASAVSTALKTPQGSSSFAAQQKVADVLKQQAK